MRGKLGTFFAFLLSVAIVVAVAMGLVSHMKPVTDRRALAPSATVEVSAQPSPSDTLLAAVEPSATPPPADTPLATAEATPPSPTSAAPSLPQSRPASDFAAYMDFARSKVDEISVQPNTSSTGMFSLGNMYYKKGAYEEAKTSYQHAMSLEPTRLGPINNYALTCLQLGENDEALRYFLVCLMLDKGYKGALVNTIAAAHALGFSAGTVYAALPESGCDLGDYVADPNLDPQMSAALTYNTVYSNVEYAQEAESGKLLSDAIERAKSYAEKTPEDTDWAGLLNYLQALEALRNPEGR